MTFDGTRSENPSIFISYHIISYRTTPERRGQFIRARSEVLPVRSCGFEQDSVSHELLIEHNHETHGAAPWGLARQVRAARLGPERFVATLFALICPGEATTRFAVCEKPEVKLDNMPGTTPKTYSQ